MNQRVAAAATSIIVALGVAASAGTASVAHAATAGAATGKAQKVIVILRAQDQSALGTAAAASRRCWSTRSRASGTRTGSGADALTSGCVEVWAQSGSAAGRRGGRSGAGEGTRRRGPGWRPRWPAAPRRLTV